MNVSDSGKALEGGWELGSLNMTLHGQSLQEWEQRGFPKSHLDFLLGLAAERVKDILLLQGYELEHLFSQVTSED